MIELFAVAPDEDEAFLAAWRAAAPAGATLHRALRRDARWRCVSFASGAPDDAGGVLLIVPFDVAAGEEQGFVAAWEPVRATFSERQGYLGAQVVHDAGARPVAVVHWSSPLMYARTVHAHGDLIAALPYRSHPALYARVSAR